MSDVAVQGLRVGYGAQPVIEGLNLQVAPGEFLVLLGPSGCGKSTLLHSIAGLTPVSAGRIAIGGRDVTEAEPSRRGIGMVFQSYALYPTMTVQGNLSFGLRMNGVAGAEVARRVQAVAELLQLAPLLQRKPAQLSGGQRQRVAIGRALVRQASVNLLDEPLSNLDAQLRAELRRELKLLHARLGSTMIHVTHDQTEAQTLATRMVVMRQGRIQQQGSPAELYERPANRFVAGFLGAPAMNFIDGRIQAVDGAPQFQGPAFALPLAGTPHAGLAAGACVLGLRPEHLCLQPGPEGGCEARVALVEPLGSHHVVWLQRQGCELACLLYQGPVPRAGECVRFGIDLSRASFFDADTGQRL